MQTRDNQVLHSPAQKTKRSHFVRALLCLLVYAATLLVPGPPHYSQASNLPDFRSGASVTEQLPVKAEKQVQVFLNSGELFQFAIVKGDLRVAVELQGPGGRQVVEYLSSSYEPVELSAVANTSGVFLLKIRSLEPGARQGEFTLTVQPIRRATGIDVKNAAAELSIATATRLSAEWTNAALRNAIEKYTEASVLAADSRIVAKALRKAGENRVLLGEYKQALDLFERAATLSERVNEQQGLLEATTQAARLHSLLGNNDKAQRALDRVFSSYFGRNVQNEPPASRNVYAQAVKSQGEILYSRGDLIRSPEYFERALKLFTETGNRNGQANTLLFLGHLANAAGQSGPAMDTFTQAYGLYREVGNKSGEGLAITARGITHTLVWKDETGIKQNREAIAIFDTIGDSQSKAIALNAIGEAYQNLGKNELALDHYKEALRLFQEGGTVDFIPATLFQIATLHRVLRNFEPALSYFEDCARLSHKNKKHRMEAYALNETASIYASQGKRGKALSQYRRAFRFLVSIRDYRGQVLTLNNIGDLHLSAGDTHEALTIYKQALPLSQRAGEQGVEVDTFYNLARAARDYGSLDEAKLYIEQAIEIIEKLRTNVASPDYRSTYFSGFRKHYDLYIGLLFQLDIERPGQGFAEKVLLASERARARTFQELLVEAGADIRQGVDPAILKREKELQHLLAAHALYEMETAGSKEPEHERLELNRRLDSLKAEYEEVQAQVRNQSLRYQALAPPKPLTIPEIQAQLGRDDLLLEYVLGEEKSYLLAVTSTSLRIHELKSKSVIEPAGLEFYKLITARQETVVNHDYQSRVEAADKQYFEKGLALSRMLLEPVAGVLAGKRLIIVPEGVLQYVPFDALPEPTSQPLNTDSQKADIAKSYLVSHHEIGLLPSVSALAAIRSEKNRPAPTSGLVAVFADPVFSNNDERVQHRSEGNTELATSFPGNNASAFRGFAGINERGGLRRLTYASDEADSIFNAASGNAWIVKGFEANRENVLSDRIGQYQIVHFATHGFVNTERPELSSIVLTMVKPDGKPVDGFLQLHDVFNLKLSAELTVLSACDTGLGKDVRGEGLIGLSRGLMFAGSRSVVASLWKVDDRATAVLMGHFYKAMLQDGLSRAAALRYAKEELRKDPAWSSPFFWAGFVLQGEYDRPIIVEQKSRFSPSVIVPVVLVIVIGSILILRSFYRSRRMNPHDRS